MRAIEEITAAAGNMTTADLEAEKHARDAIVVQLRAEQQVIHDILEPRWYAANAGNSNAGSLAQRVVVTPLNFSDQIKAVAPEGLKGMVEDLLAELKRRFGNGQ